MGNIIMVRRKKARVMKIDGDTFRLKTPAMVSDVTKEYPGLVLLDSDLTSNKTYFLVELPNLETAAEEADKRNKLPYRRVMSGVHVGAKERLEMLMVSRRSVSDVAIARCDGEDGLGPGQTRMRLRLPRSQIMTLMGESHDASEVMERIIALYRESSGEIQGGRDGDDFGRKLGTEDLKNNCKSREVIFKFV